MFNSIFEANATGMRISDALICAAVAFALGLIIAFVHLKTSKTTKGMLVTLAILPILVMAVMMMVNGNLGTSIAILGAFALIRFRSVAATAKDILDIFFSMTIGLALGMGEVLFAVVITLIAVLAILLISFTHFLEPNKNERVLKVVIPEDMDYEEVFDKIFKKYTTKAELMKMKTMNMGSLYKLTYDVVLKPKMKEKAFLDEIREKNCNLKVLLSHSECEEDI